MSPSPSGGPSGGAEFNLSDPVGSFISTVRNVLFNPVGFFRAVPRRGNFVNPLIFAAICALISGLLSGIIGFLFALIGGDVVSAILGLIGAIILTPIVTVIGLFIGAGIYHLLVLLLVRPSNAGFEATFRVVAYSSALALVSWLTAIPFLGILIALVVLVYAIFLYVVGIREVHATTTGRAALVVLIPTAVILLLALLVAVAIGAALFLGGQPRF